MTFYCQSEGHWKPAVGSMSVCRPQIIYNPLHAVESRPGELLSKKKKRVWAEDRHRGWPMVWSVNTKRPRWLITYKSESLFTTSWSAACMGTYGRALVLQAPCMRHHGWFWFDTPNANNWGSSTFILSGDRPLTPKWTRRKIDCHSYHLPANIWSKFDIEKSN